MTSVEIKDLGNRVGKFLYIINPRMSSRDIVNNATAYLHIFDPDFNVDDMDRRGLYHYAVGSAFEQARNED
jgi:hypothetical protein